MGSCLETPVLVFFCVDVVVDDDKHARSHIALRILFLSQEKRMNLRGLFRGYYCSQNRREKKKLVWPLGGSSKEKTCPAGIKQEARF